MLAFDGPGQGSVIIDRGVPFRPDWENVITPVVDFLQDRPDVDPERIALIGLSFGGYLAPRAATAEHRLAACISDCGPYDLFDATARRLPGFMARQLPDGNPALLRLLGRLVRSVMNKPTAGWALRRNLMVHGLSDPLEYFRIAPQYSLKGIEHRISCPTFVCSAEDDDLSVDARKLYDALTCPKQYLQFRSAEGAGQHCESGARTLFHQQAFDWLDQVLNPAHAEPVMRVAPQPDRPPISNRDPLMKEKAMVLPAQESVTAAPFGLEGLDVVPEPDRAEIVTTLSALFTGFAQRNADVLTDVYTADADWVNAFGSVKNGGPEIVGYLRGLFADQNFNDGQLAAPPRGVLRLVTDEVASSPPTFRSPARASSAAAPSRCATTAPCTSCRSSPAGGGGSSPRCSWTPARTRATSAIHEHPRAGWLRHRDRDRRRPYLVLIVTVGVRVLQLKAAMPVMARPMIRMCTSSVPS